MSDRQPSWAALLAASAATAALTSAAMIALLRKTPSPPPPGSKRPAGSSVVDLRALPASDVPAVLRVESYLSADSMQSFAHAAIFRDCPHVFALLDAIHPFLERFFAEQRWRQRLDASASFTTLSPDHESKACPSYLALSARTKLVVASDATFRPDRIINRSAADRELVVLSGAVVLGGTLDVTDGCILLGDGVVVEPYAVVKGPSVIESQSTLRSGAYLRGDVLVGRGVVLRGELKNALVLDRAELCHPGYCGDSICGARSHFGNQVTTANLNLFTSGAVLVDVEQADGRRVRYNTGRRKIGVVLGDDSQLGCSAVTDPCTLLLPRTVAYPLARLSKGVYGPDVIIKNKPMEKGVLEIARVRRS
ncbi:hypothetical protein ATCC90586_007157 [Pythium insidiosum]|nr:hypothetical protein ATCC90586_007157 [Pythium insidiosum]